MPKLTNWYPATVNPSVPGVYKVINNAYRYWDGKHWYLGSSLTPNKALQAKINTPVKTVAKPWCGLAKKPN
ncbi:MAG TPA: hypothetical protein VFM18_21775 [Methanosarcina sp.]|nr:hypothetical protein [Methanosarcina sp.]